MGIIIDNGDQHLYVEANGGYAPPYGPRAARAIVVQYDEAEAWRFELTEMERLALIQSLTIAAPTPTPAICYRDDHVPGCEHEAMARFDQAVDRRVLEILGGLTDPPCDDPPWDYVPLRDRLDDPHGAGTPG